MSDRVSDLYERLAAVGIALDHGKTSFVCPYCGGRHILGSQTTGIHLRKLEWQAKAKASQPSSESALDRIAVALERIADALEAGK